MNRRRYLNSADRLEVSQVVKWCRKHFGERGNGWDFDYLSDKLWIEIWDDRHLFLYALHYEITEIVT